VATRTLTGVDFLSVNTFEQPDAVRLVEGRVEVVGNGRRAVPLTYTFPAHSLTALVLRQAG
jgi:hypothetical protein